MTFTHAVPDYLLFLAFLAAVTVTVWSFRRFRHNRVVWIRRILIMVLAFVIGLTPATMSQMQASGPRADIIVALDRTTSMSARDSANHAMRLRAAASDLQKLANQWAGARFHVISVGANTRVEIPATTDADAVITWAKTLTPEIYDYADGSALSHAVPVIKEQLRQSETSAGGTGTTILVVMSDGEATRSSNENEWTTLPKVDHAAVFQYGTATPAPMYAYRGGGKYDSAPLIDPLTNTQATTRADHAALVSIADALHGSVYVRNKGGDLSDFTSSVTASVHSLGTRQEMRDVVWPFAWILILLFAWEAWEAGGRIRVWRYIHTHDSHRPPKKSAFGKSGENRKE